MNTFQICHNTTDLTPLYLPQQLYLKPIARINISLQLPNIKKIGKSVSHWDIMDQIRTLIKPEEFTTLKVTKTTVEFVRLEGELDSKDKIDRILPKIHNKMIKLKDFGELMRLKAAEWKSDFPTRRAWDDFFQNSRDMDEMKPGQRPDTVHISHLPSKWFVPYHLSGEEEVTPSEKIFYRIFEKFGQIRSIDIPICDPYRKKMNANISGLKTSSFDNTQFFEGYVQYKDYIGFTKAMDALKNMKLVHKDEDSMLEVDIKVDFDKSKHLSEASIRRREIVRDRLVRKAREQEEKDKAKLEEIKKKEELERQKEIDLKEQKKLRRKLREEKRKAKILEKLEISGSDEINEKIANEEKKLLKVQRKLEAIRLLEELFRRIQEKNPENVPIYEGLTNQSHDELTRFKNSSELEVLNQKQKLHNALKGRVMLKTILAGGKKIKRSRSDSTDSDLSLDLEIPATKRRPTSPVIQKYPELMYDPGWVGYPSYIPPGPMFPETYPIGSFLPRGRSFPRLPNIPGPSRGGYGRRRSGYRFRGTNRGGGNFKNYPPDLEEEFLKFLNEHEDRKRKSYSPSRRSRRRTRSRSRSRRSYSHSRSRSRKRRSRSRRSRSYSYRSRSRSYTRSRTRSRSKDKRLTRSRSRNRNRSRSKSRGRSGNRENKTETNVDDRKSKSREKSVDSSSFMTPRQLQRRRERSKSWSLMREGEAKGRSWSKSPEKKE
ncbi:A-kinase anchor protein 17A isoform X1 [Diorhabda carinulata]|uniref:A-kinase anchor protein 17A isoform X1 n=2 Tax=Diorhabda carinulata TaxID=1163345 RepID=UPI0025A1CD52|nr:A-kinase anchor protein 17A isoform X1 [Diorhabda carinulata]